MPRNKWYKEKFCSYLQAPYFQVGNENINFFLIEYLDVSTRFMKILITKRIYIFISVYVFLNICVNYLIKFEQQFSFGHVDTVSTT